MSQKPRRIQRKRAPGWRMPPNAVYVGRPTIFGNPWTRAEALATGLFRPEFIPQMNVDEFRRWLTNPAEWCEKHRKLTDRREQLLKTLPLLRGKDLACWCPLDQPCHADVLLELLEREPKVEVKHG